MRAAISALAAAKLHPTRDNVLVRRRPNETATPGGVMIPETVRRPLNLGSVVAVGPGRRAPGGTLIPSLVAPGDEAALERDSGTEITLAGERLIVVSEQAFWGSLSTGPRRSARAHRDRHRRANLGAGA